VVGVELLPLAVFLISFWRDPRTFRTGLYLLVALLGGALSAFWLAIDASAVLGDLGPALLLLAGILLVVGTIVGLAVFLVVTGVTLLRREGFGISRLLGLGLGVAMLAYGGLAVAVVAANSTLLFIWFLLLGLPAAYLGMAFVAFLVYGSLYPALMARLGGPVAAVVVLGSGLVDGRVPPLLASRLRRGRQVFERLATRGTRPQALVTSGGRGPDEPVAEASAMADYLVEDGLPGDLVLVEDRSRNTDENLSNTAELLKARGISGPIAVVTSDFHAFRAALIMRRHGLAGYSVGAPTARYYWPSAVIREFIAVLRDHFWLNAVLLAVSLLPLLVTLIVMGTAQR
jgi:uncharacterized SAM-binding protein YcdF (DUF218 family)